MIRHRAEEKEWMDDLNLDSDDLKATLHDIHSLNKYLGGHRSIIGGMRRAIVAKNIKEGSTIRVVEVGCGLGDNLIAITEKFGNRFHLECTGIDANPHIVKYAASKNSCEEIRFECRKMKPEDFRDLHADVLIIALFLHHFRNDEILGMLSAIDPEKVRTVLISDLQRSSISVTLYKLISSIFRLNKMAVNDGLISIKKGFTKREFSDLLHASKFRSIKTSRRFAFRLFAILS